MDLSKINRTKLGRVHLYLEKEPASSNGNVYTITDGVSAYGVLDVTVLKEYQENILKEPLQGIEQNFRVGDVPYVTEKGKKPKGTITMKQLVGKLSSGVYTYGEGSTYPLDKTGAFLDIPSTLKKVKDTGKCSQLAKAYGVSLGAACLELGVAYKENPEATLITYNVDSQGKTKGNCRLVTDLEVLQEICLPYYFLERAVIEKYDESGNELEIEVDPEINMEKIELKNVCDELFIRAKALYEIRQKPEKAENAIFHQRVVRYAWWDLCEKIPARVESEEKEIENLILKARKLAFKYPEVTLPNLIPYMDSCRYIPVVPKGVDTERYLENVDLDEYFKVNSEGIVKSGYIKDKKSTKKSTEPKFTAREYNEILLDNVPPMLIQLYLKPFEEKRVDIARGSYVEYYMKDPDSTVRALVASSGHCLDYLVNDPSPHVRKAIAPFSQYTSILSKDESVDVRKAVASLPVDPAFFKEEQNSEVIRALIASRSLEVSELDLDSIDSRAVVQSIGSDTFSEDKVNKLSEKFKYDPDPDVRYTLSNLTKNVDAKNETNHRVIYNQIQNEVNLDWWIDNAPTRYLKELALNSNSKLDNAPYYSVETLYDKYILRNKNKKAKTDFTPYLRLTESYFFDEGYAGSDMLETFGAIIFNIHEYPELLHTGNYVGILDEKEGIAYVRTYEDTTGNSLVIQNDSDLNSLTIGMENSVESATVHSKQEWLQKYPESEKVVKQLEDWMVNNYHVSGNQHISGYDPERNIYIYCSQIEYDGLHSDYSKFAWENDYEYNEGNCFFANELVQSIDPYDAHRNGIYLGVHS